MLKLKIYKNCKETNNNVSKYFVVNIKNPPDDYNKRKERNNQTKKKLFYIVLVMYVVVCLVKNGVNPKLSFIYVGQQLLLIYNTPCYFQYLDSYYLTLYQLKFIKQNFQETKKLIQLI